MDCDGHGDSDNYKDNPMDAFFTVTANPGSAFEDISTSPGSGMCDVVNYAYNSLSFVDKDQIGITGHSLGGKMANACLAYNKIQEANGGVNQVAAVFLMGNQQLNIDGVWQDHLNYDPDDTPDSGDEIPLYYDVDYGIDAGQLDENNYQTEAGGPQTSISQPMQEFSLTSLIIMICRKAMMLKLVRSTKELYRVLRRNISVLYISLMRHIF